MSDPTTRSLGSFSSGLSLAVQPVDRYTGGTPAADLRVRIEGRDAEPIRTPSGFHVFLDIEAGTETVVVEGSSRYVDGRETGVEVIDLSDPGTTVDPADPATLPVETVKLAPSTAYEFPAGATLLRGVVTDPSDEPLPDTAVSATGTESETRTDENGEYVLFFDPVTDDDVAVRSGTSVVQADGDPPELTVDHADHGTTSQSLEDAAGHSIVEEGAVTRHDVAFS